MTTSTTKPEVQFSRLGDDLAVVSLFGEHDLATATELRKTLSSLLEQAIDIVVDLSGTAFIDSSIIKAFISSQRLASKHGARIGFQVQKNTPAGRVFELCGLMNAWPTYRSREEAIAMLRQARAKAETLDEPRRHTFA